MLNKTFATLVFGALLQTSFSQTLDKAKLDAYFQELEKTNKFMGSVALSENGQIVYTKAIGFSDVETKVKPNENTKYRIGSISKSFTSVLVLKAVEEDKLTLDIKLNKFFPKIKNADKITISNLLNHRSGIHNFTNDSTYLDWHTQYKSETEMVRIIGNGGSDFEPDSKAEYSNSNFVLLSYILQKVYNQNYSEILTEKIIKAIDLKNTFVGNSSINLNNNECNSYKYLMTWEKESETNLSVPMGAGNIISTPSDLTKFSFALFNAKIISSGSVDLMTTIKDQYGYGLLKLPFGDKTGYGHTGGIDGFSSVYGYFPTEKAGFAITSNGSNYSINNISIVLLSSIFKKPYEIQVFKSFELKTEDLDKYLGGYSSKDISIKITITKNDRTLKAQATGQSAFELEATEKDTFKFYQAGVEFDFNPTDKSMILKQGGRIFTFTKE